MKKYIDCPKVVPQLPFNIGYYITDGIIILINNECTKTLFVLSLGLYSANLCLVIEKRFILKSYKDDVRIIICL